MLECFQRDGRFIRLPRSKCFVYEQKNVSHYFTTRAGIIGVVEYKYNHQTKIISLLNNLSFVYTLQVSKIGEVGMWLDASTQIFYSLSLSFGGIITMSAGNDIRNNCLRDAIMVSVINCCTSLFAGIVIFSILGYKVIVLF